MTATTENVTIQDLSEKQEGIVLTRKEDKDLSSLLETEVFKEIKKRIRSGDSNALDVLMAAKERIKYELPIYKNAIKLTICALKPFYLITVISILSQTPTNA